MTNLTVPLFSDPDLFDEIATMHATHARNTAWWRDMNTRIDSAREELRDCLIRQGSFSFGPLGPIQFEYIEMGAVSTLDLFGLDELIIFAFYWKSRNRYKKVVDMGANIGLHTVVLGLMGYDVTSYEPDPETFVRLQGHIVANELSTRVKAVNKAVDTKPGIAQFVRVLGNATGSHLQGAKSRAYGDLEVIPVPTAAFDEVIESAELVKMDVEGAEGRLLRLGAIRSQEREHDYILEIGSELNAREVWHSLSSWGVNSFAQKINWQRATSVTDLPMSHHDGSFFISASASDVWP